MSVPPDLPAILERLAAIGPDPWVLVQGEDSRGYRTVAVHCDPEPQLAAGAPLEDIALSRSITTAPAPIATLIAHAPGDLAALAARVAALEAECATQRATLADPRVAAALAEIQADEDAAVDHITDSPHRAALIARLAEIADGQPHPWADATDFELHDMGLDCGGPGVIKATPSAARVLARLISEPTP
jgi:hypothetical protein